MSSPQQARAIETRDRLLRGAAETFSAKGYEGSTIDDILAASGVSKGSMYFHFESKAALGRAIVVLQTEMVSGFELDNQVPAAQQLIDASFAFGRALQSDPLIRASVRMTTEGHGFDDEQRIAFNDWLNFVTELSNRAISEGDIRGCWSASEVAQTLAAGVNGSQQSSLIYSNYVDILDRLHAFWRMIAPGLFTREAAERLRY